MARVGLLAGVRPEMHGQVARRQVGGPTHGTPMGPFPSVASNVASQLIGGGEQFATYVTGVSRALGPHSRTLFFGL